MRELKFRAWTRRKPSMPWSQKFVAITGNGEQMVPIGGTFTGVWHILGDDAEGLIIEQYTGLKDKNGEEIYEGDIVEYMTCYFGNEKRHRKVVEWGEWDSDDFGEPHNLGYFDLNEYMEVIGNIHENPELLEEEE